MTNNNGQREEISLTNELFRRKEANVSMITFLGVLVILSGINMIHFSSSIYDDAVNARIGEEWLVEFDLNKTTNEIVEILQDEEVYVLEIDPSQMDLPANMNMGLLEISILPEETAGTNPNDPLGQCDSVSATLSKNDFSAQWDDNRNILSGQDSSCDAIDLALIIYPEFTGNSSVVTVPNEYQALMTWTDTGWGDGIVELVLELDTNYIEELGIVTEDADEELRIVISFTSFKAKASLKS